MKKNQKFLFQYWTLVYNSRYFPILIHTYTNIFPIKQNGLHLGSVKETPLGCHFFLPHPQLP